MPLLFSALVWLLVGTQAPASVEEARYMPSAAPIATATLFIDGQTHLVSILDETNVQLRLVPAEYQDLDIAKSLDIICDLPGNQNPLTVSARIDTRYHMIPLDIIEYKDYDRSYMKLGIDAIYIRNNIFGPGLANHKVYLDFYASGQGVR